MQVEGEEVVPIAKFDGEIRVGAKIIDYLSSGLYESPAQCLKELINNSFDADATKVEVFVKPDADRIIIEDNGTGMTREEFQRHFERISESHKRDEREATELGRPKIGKIGIGFIAANELCDVLEIYSTQQGSPEMLHVHIDFSRLRQEDTEPLVEGGEVVKGDYEGEILPAPPDDRFTRVILRDVSKRAKYVMAGATREAEFAYSLYGLSQDSVIRRLRDQNLRSWGELDHYSETMLQVALNVPVPYAPDWMPSTHRTKVAEFEKQAADLDFHVSYDGSELCKPVVFPPSGKALVRVFNIEQEGVSARGYFYAQHGVVRPVDLQGLLLRIRNAAVGDYDPTFWDFPSSRHQLIRRWVSGEVWADDRLEEAMNIDRRTMRVVHPAYVELRAALHKELLSFLEEVRKQIYGVAAEKRQEARSSGELEAVEEVISDRQTLLGRAVARDVIAKWQAAAEDHATRRRLLRRLRVSDLYDIVVSVAEEVLEPSELRRFIKALTNHLTQ